MFFKYRSHSDGKKNFYNIRNYIRYNAAHKNAEYAYSAGVVRIKDIKPKGAERIAHEK